MTFETYAINYKKNTNRNNLNDHYEPVAGIDNFLNKTSFLLGHCQISLLVWGKEKDQYFTLTFAWRTLATGGTN